MTTTMINLAAAERIKLLSTRSFWWCAAVTALLVVGMAVPAALDSTTFPTPVVSSRPLLAMPLVQVMAACAVTGGYRHRTIRATFLAVPARPQALLAKTAVVATAAAGLGLVGSLGAFTLLTGLRPDVSWMPQDVPQWRAVLGVAPVFAVSAVIGLAVGILLRRTAGAVALLLLWPIGEVFLTMLPNVGDALSLRMPFLNVSRFLSEDTDIHPSRSMFDPPLVSSPGGALTEYIAVAAVLLALALMVANRRDA
jgi:ABC-2 type transport system permease protein